MQTQMQIPNAPVTVLFADVVGSTRIYDQIGDEAASTLIGGVLRQVTEVASQAGGRHMKNIGDCVMLQFSGTPAAFLAARGIIAGRPFESVDELVRVYGIGEKTLAKIREFVRVD